MGLQWMNVLLTDYDTIDGFFFKAVLEEIRVMPQHTFEKRIEPNKHHTSHYLSYNFILKADSIGITNKG
jgi:hypothetical protein